MQNEVTGGKTRTFKDRDKIDVANFEEELKDFKKAFGKTTISTKKFSVAIDQIDKSIKFRED